MTQNVSWGDFGFWKFGLVWDRLLVTWNFHALKHPALFQRSGLLMEEIILKVYLQPKSSKNEVVGPHRDGIKVKVTAPPVEGKANEALIRFLAKEFGISPSAVEIIKGLHSREKTLRVSSTPLDGRLDLTKKLSRKQKI